MLENLYKRPIPSTRTGALYNAFSYPTKISSEVIAVYIAAHTKPGDTILDVFSGSGSTGLAALLCDTPTEKMRSLARDMNLSVEWGPRKAHLVDVGTLGSFVAKTMCSKISSKEFEQQVSAFLIEAKKELEWVYQAKDSDGNIGSIRHIVWSDIVICTKCSAKLPYIEVAVDLAPVSFNEHFDCPECGSVLSSKECERATQSVHDPLLNKTVTQKVRVPAIVYGTTGKSQWRRHASPSDIQLTERISEQPIPESAPISELQWGELYRSGYHRGVSHLHHFYTRRNFYVMSKLWEMSLNVPTKMRAAIQLLLLSYNSSHSTLMTRVVAKKEQKDFVLTGAQSGVLYISSLPVEKNILLGIERKSRTLVKAFAQVEKSASEVSVHNQSSTALPLECNSVDYVYTDPPFGDYIPYAEINQINELWLESLTDRKKEIVISRSQEKDLQDYQLLMGNVFEEISRVLKPEGLATVVFHSAKADVWNALIKAYNDAALTVHFTSILDKQQNSFKQTNSIVSVKGDPLILLRHDPDPSRPHKGSEEILGDLFSRIDEFSATEREPARLFSLYINRCLEDGAEIGVGAQYFYNEVKRRSI